MPRRGGVVAILLVARKLGPPPLPLLLGGGELWLPSAIPCLPITWLIKVDSIIIIHIRGPIIHILCKQSA